MEVRHAIQERRSIRRFKSDAVPVPDIEKMVYAASLAPSGGNMQPWQFLAITNKECRDALARIIHDEGVKFSHDMGQAMPHFIVTSLVFTTAPLVFAVMMTPFPLEEDSWFQAFRKRKNLEGRSIDRYGGFVSVMGVAAAIENLLLTAYDLGYGSCWVRIPYYAKDALERFLNIEAPRELVALLPVGIADTNPRMPPRKPIQDIFALVE